jgi:hypothetical protein
MNILKFLFSLLLPLVLVAQEVDPELLRRGYQVFKQSCSLCHMERASLWDFLKARLKVLKGERPENIEAPPMNLISARIKKFYPNEVEFVEFVKDYITHPSREKGVCFKAAYVFFGTMPPIGQGMSEEEKTAVALWLYYRFSDRWDDLFRGVKELQKRVQSKK